MYRSPLQTVLILFVSLTVLNDMRNLETAVKAANKENGHAQIALSYTLGDAYTLDYWKDMAKKIEDMGAKSTLYQRYGRTFDPIQSHRAW